MHSDIASGEVRTTLEIEVIGTIDSTVQTIFPSNSDALLLDIVNNY
jgi:hypothetical protein